MTTKTVYIPVTITSEGELTDSQAEDIGNEIVAMLRDGFYCNDNVWDAATEADVMMTGFKIDTAMT